MAIVTDKSKNGQIVPEEHIDTKWQKFIDDLLEWEPPDPEPTDPWTVHPWEGTRAGTTATKIGDRIRGTSAGSTLAIAAKITGLEEGSDFRIQIVFQGGSETVTGFYVRCGEDPTLSTYDKNLNKSLADVGQTMTFDITAPAGDYYVGVVATVTGAGDYAECDYAVTITPL